MWNGNGIVRLLRTWACQGLAYSWTALGISGIFLALSYLIATYPSNKRRH